MRYGTFRFGEFLFGEIGRGYKVFLSRNTPPVVGVDAPVAIVDDLAAVAALDVTTLGLVANSTYYGAVVPFNEFGDAVGPAEFSFTTDGAGYVQLVPDVIQELRAVPLSGGRLRVSWVYAPANASHVVAEDFEIEVDLLTEAEPPEVFDNDPVPHRQPQRTYSVDLGPMSEGLATVRVFSRRGGLYEANVQAAQARIDAAAPTAVSMGMAAV